MKQYDNYDPMKTKRNDGTQNSDINNYLSEKEYIRKPICNADTINLTSLTNKKNILKKIVKKPIVKQIIETTKPFQSSLRSFRSNYLFNSNLGYIRQKKSGFLSQRSRKSSKKLFFPSIMQRTFFQGVNSIFIKKGLKTEELKEQDGINYGEFSKLALKLCGIIREKHSRAAEELKSGQGKLSYQSKLLTKNTINGSTYTNLQRIENKYFHL